jgi:Zn-dependent protease
MLTYFSPRINGILQSKLLVGGNYIGFVSIILNSFNNASTARCCTVFYVDLIRISLHVFLFNLFSIGLSQL